MAEFLMLMRGSGDREHWAEYVEKLMSTGQFRGGSAFGNGRALNAKLEAQACIATGCMRFEAPSIDEVELFLSDNPTIKAGGSIELHELIVTG